MNREYTIARMIGFLMGFYALAQRNSSPLVPRIEARLKALCETRPGWPEDFSIDVEQSNKRRIVFTGTRRGRQSKQGAVFFHYDVIVKPAFNLQGFALRVKGGTKNLRHDLLREYLNWLSMTGTQLSEDQWKAVMDSYTVNVSDYPVEHKV